MTRQHEIDLLQQLKEDTYFGEYFTGAEIDKMCENIKNDHPIDCGIDKMDKQIRTNLQDKLVEASKLIEEHRMMIGSIEQRLDKMTEIIVRLMYEPYYNLSDGYADAEETVGVEGILAIKIERGLPLSEAEKKAIIGLLK